MTARELARVHLAQNEGHTVRWSYRGDKALLVCDTCKWTDEVMNSPEVDPVLKPKRKKGG